MGPDNAAGKIDARKFGKVGVGTTDSDAKAQTGAEINNGCNDDENGSDKQPRVNGRAVDNLGEPDVIRQNFGGKKCNIWISQMNL